MIDRAFDHVQSNHPERLIMRTEEQGLREDELIALLAIAPLDRWTLQWDEAAREWVTAVTCPCCSAHLQFEVGALSEFYCSDCGYDWLDDNDPRKLPAPAHI